MKREGLSYYGDEARDQPYAVANLTLLHSQSSGQNFSHGLNFNFNFQTAIATAPIEHHMHT